MVRMISRPRPRTSALVVALALLLCAVGNAEAAAASALAAHGYAVLPEPQQVALRDEDFSFGPEWHLDWSAGIRADDVAIESLQEGLKMRFGVSLQRQSGKSGHGKVVWLSIEAGAVAVGKAADRDKDELARQAYRINLAAESIRITANAPPGLFYGVETLVQLIKPRSGELWLPAGQIVDWPDLQLRQIFWDDARHLDHLDEIKRAIRQAAFFKVNGFVLKPDAHFQYKNIATIVNPYALSPADLQELTDFALRFHTQLIPYLDGPGHVEFILKYPEYEKLRAFPESNYEMCVTNPDTYKLYFGMFDELLAANKGGKYFLLSTDEPYYVGLAKNAQCNEVDRARELGSVGRLLAEFITRTANYLHERGRKVIFWGEYPLKPGDIASLPSHLVNGEVYGPEFDPVFRAHGIRQTIYTSTSGEEYFFPEYYLLPAVDRLHQERPQALPKVTAVLDQIAHTSARQQSDLMGVFIAAWADQGIHPETFWLGFATGAAAGWNPEAADPAASIAAFYELFYGPGATRMGRVYQLMSTQARFWEDSWEWAASAARKPIFGNSDAIWNPPRPAHDQTLQLPPVPTPDLLKPGWDWNQANARRLELAAKFLAQNDELLDLLHANLASVRFNRHNLEVFLSVARLYRQNLEMLLALGNINEELKSAQAAAGKGDSGAATAAIDRALDLAEEVRRERSAVLEDATRTWYKTWFPRVEEANGRRFLHVLNDVQDYFASRTVDMSYLVYRELLYPLGDWAEHVRAARNKYAKAHGLPAREARLEWKGTTPSAQR